jgi:outer membrane protein TolC
MAPRERIDCTAALLLAAAAAGALAAAGCSAEQYKKDADHEVAEILARKQKDFHKFSEETGFTIEQAHDALRAQLVAALAELRAAHQGEPPVHHETNLAPPESSRDQADEALRDRMVEIRQERARHLAEVEKAHAADLTPFQANDPSPLPARKIRLLDAVAIAAENNRDYQRQKEQVYLSALDLTFQRYQFENHYGVSSDYQWTSIDNPGDNGRTRQGSLTTSLSITRQLETGGLLVFDFTNTLLKNFTGITFSNGKDTTYGSLMDITFSQPLLRGAGFTIAEEPLVQSERDVYYQMRDYERFRQVFAVQVAREYMNLLVLRDSADNARVSYLQLIDVQEQSTAKGVRGRLPEIQVGQARQAELSARNSWITLERAYQDALDGFKITLGLPMEAELEPDAADLDELRAVVPQPTPLSDTEAAAIALAHRYDHLNELARLDDTERRVHVTEDALRAALGVNGGVSVPTKQDSVFGLQGGRTTWSAGVALDLPLDRLSERNQYRAALINVELQKRVASLSEDEVRQDVRVDVRKLAQVMETVRLQRLGVEVAERREASTALQLSMGRSQIRDYTDAVNSLNDARNALTRALIDHHIGELELSRDIGLIELRTDGIRPKFTPDPPPPAPTASGEGQGAGSEGNGGTQG